MPLTDLLVLAVDDNEAHRYALAKMLRAQGHCEVNTASTGAEAIASATGVTPSVILLDVNLPDVNGWEVCRRLRTMPALNHVPIIFLTATYQSSSAKEKALSVGANTLLFYPVETEHLFAVIRGQVARAQEHG